MDVVLFLFVCSGNASRSLKITSASKRMEQSNTLQRIKAHQYQIDNAKTLKMKDSFKTNVHNKNPQDDPIVFHMYDEKKTPQETTTTDQYAENHQYKRSLFRTSPQAETGESIYSTPKKVPGRKFEPSLKVPKSGRS